MEADLKEQAEKAGVEENLVFHGFLSPGGCAGSWRAATSMCLPAIIRRAGVR